MKATRLARVMSFVRTIPRWFASNNVGALLIIATFGFMLLAAFFPGSGATHFVRSLGQALALDSLANAYQLTFEERFQSPTFLLLIGAVCLSLGLSLFFRIRAEIRRRRAEALSAQRDAALLPRGGTTAAAAAKIEQELKRRGYRTRVAMAEGAWQVHGNKGGSGVWGSVLFHVGMLLVIAAVALNTLASFHGSVKLTEWQAFDARTDSYGKQSAGRWFTPPEQPLTFRLIRVEPDYEVDGAGTVASIIEPTLDGKTTRFAEQAPVYISHGLHHAGMTLHQGSETGFAPQVIIEDATGERLLDGYTRLATLSGPEKMSYADYIEIPGKGKKIRVEFELLPDAVFRNGAYLNRSGSLKYSVLHVVVRESDKVMFDQFIPVTRDVSEGGYTVFFGGVRRWSQIDVVHAPGVPVLIAATLMGALGLLLRLLSVRRRIVVSLSGTGGNQPVAFDIAGSSEKFTHTFNEELDSIRAALAQQFSHGYNGEPIAERMAGNA